MSCLNQHITSPMNYPHTPGVAAVCWYQPTVPHHRHIRLQNYFNLGQWHCLRNVVMWYNFVWFQPRAAQCLGCEWAGIENYYDSHQLCIFKVGQVFIWSAKGTVAQCN